MWSALDCIDVRILGGRVSSITLARVAADQVGRAVDASGLVSGCSCRGPRFVQRVFQLKVRCNAFYIVFK
jgi:hypothetical protein